MNKSDLLKFALSGLGQHKLRTLLTLMGVTLGSLLLFVSLAGGLGVTETINRRLDVGERLLQINVSSGVKLNPVTLEKARDAGFTEEMSDERRVRLATARGVGGRTQIPLTIAAVKDLEAIPNVSDVWPVINFQSAMFFESSKTWGPASVKAILPNKDLSQFIIAGRELKKDETQGILVNELYLYTQGFKREEDVSSLVGTKVRLVPANAAAAITAQAIGAQLKNAKGPDAEKKRMAINAKVEEELAKANIQPDEFEIVGVLRTPTAREIELNYGLSDYRQNVLMPHKAASPIWKRVNAPARRISIIARAEKPEYAPRVEESIRKLGFQTNSLAKLAHQIRTSVLLITAIVTAIAAAALLIAGIGITNTMVMNVLERRREIAIMKSIGAQDQDVSRIFLMEGMLIGLIGGIAGLIFGYILSQMTGGYIRDILEWRLNEPFGDEIFAYPFWLVLATPLVATIVTTIASAIPARQAAKVDPVKTLQAL